MANSSVRAAHLKDTEDFYEDLKSGNLPAVLREAQRLG
jgi:hypothetical protein